MRSKALFAPRPALAKRAARDTRNETAASTEKPKSRYRRSRSANRAALRAERATPTSRRAASARNGVLTCRSASFGRRACRERRVRFASPSRMWVVARRKRRDTKRREHFQCFLLPSQKARSRGVGVSNGPGAWTSSGSRCDVSDACDHVRATPNRRASHARVHSAASRARDPPAHRLRTATRLRSWGRVTWTVAVSRIDEQWPTSASV